MKDDAIFEDEQVIVGSYEPLPPYRGFIGDDLLENGVAITDAQGKNRKGITFRAFIQDDETMAFRWKGSKEGTPPAVVEGAVDATGEKVYQVAFACASDGDGPSGADTCSGIEAKGATSEALITTSLPEGSAYQMTINNVAATADATEHTITATGLTGSGGDVSVRITKRQDDVIDDFGDSTGAGPLTLTLGPKQGSTATLVTPTAPTTMADVSERVVTLTDDETNSTIGFADITAIGAKAEGTPIGFSGIKIAGDKRAGKDITPFIQIVDADGATITGEDAAEIAGIKIAKGQNRGAATATIQRDGDNVIPKSATPTGFRIKLLANDDATKNFARTPIDTDKNEITFSIIDGDSATAKLTAFYTADTFAELTSSATPSTATGAITAIKANTGFAAAQPGTADDEDGGIYLRVVLDDTGTAKTLDDDLDFTITLAQTGGITKLLRTDFGTPAVLGTSTVAASQTGVGSIAWGSGTSLILSGTLTSGASQMFIQLPINDDSAVEDVEAFTATLSLNKANVNDFRGLTLDSEANQVTLSIDSDDKSVISLRGTVSALAQKEGGIAPFGSSRTITTNSTAFTANLFKQTNAPDNSKSAFALHFAYTVTPDANSAGASYDDLHPNLYTGTGDARTAATFYTSVSGHGIGQLGASGNDRAHLFTAPAEWAVDDDGFEPPESFNVTLTGLYITDEAGKTSRSSDSLHTNRAAAAPNYATSLFGGDITIATSTATLLGFTGGNVVPITLLNSDTLDSSDAVVRPTLTLAAKNNAETAHGYVVEEDGTDAERTVTLVMTASHAPAVPFSFYLEPTARGTSTGESPSAAVLGTDFQIVGSDGTALAAGQQTAANLKFDFAKGATIAKLKLRAIDNAVCKPVAIRLGASNTPATLSLSADTYAAATNMASSYSAQRETKLTINGSEVDIQSDAENTALEAKTRDRVITIGVVEDETANGCQGGISQRDASDAKTFIVADSTLTTPQNRALNLSFIDTLDGINGAVGLSHLLRIKLAAGHGLTTTQTRAIYDSIQVSAGADAAYTTTTDDTVGQTGRFLGITDNSYELAVHYPLDFTLEFTDSAGRDADAKDAIVDNLKNKTFVVEVIGPYGGYAPFNLHYKPIPRATSTGTPPNLGAGAPTAPAAVLHSFNVRVTKPISGGRLHPAGSAVPYADGAGIDALYSGTGSAKELDLDFKVAEDATGDDWNVIRISVVGEDNSASSTIQGLDFSAREILLRSGFSKTTTPGTASGDGGGATSHAHDSFVMKANANIKFNFNDVSFGTPRRTVSLANKNLKIEVYGSFRDENVANRQARLATISANRLVQTIFVGLRGSSGELKKRSSGNYVSLAKPHGEKFTVAGADGNGISFQVTESGDSNGSLSHGVRIRLKDGHGLSASEQMAIFKTGGTLLRGGSGFKLVKGNTHQTLLVRNNNQAIAFIPEQVTAAWGKTFVMELIGPFTTNQGHRVNSAIQAFNPTTQVGEYTGGEEVGAGTPRDKIWVRNSVEIEVTSPYGFVKTYSATASSRVAIPAGGVSGELRGDIVLGYYNDGPTEVTQSRTYSAYDNIMRIRLEGETGAAGDIQGLTQAQRNGIYKSFRFLVQQGGSFFEKKLTDSNPVVRATNSHFLARLEEAGTFAIASTHPAAVGKKFIVDLIGPYASTDNIAFPAAAYTNPLGTSNATILDSFRLTLTPDTTNRVAFKDSDGTLLSGKQTVIRGRKFEFEFTESDGIADNYYAMRIKLVAGHGLNAAQTRAIFEDLSVSYDGFADGDNRRAIISDKAERSDSHFAIALPQAGSGGKTIEIAIGNGNAAGKEFSVELYGPYNPNLSGITLGTDPTFGTPVITNEADGLRSFRDIHTAAEGYAEGGLVSRFTIGIENPPSSTQTANLQQLVGARFDASGNYVSGTGTAEAIEDSSLLRVAGDQSTIPLKLTAVRANTDHTVRIRLKGYQGLTHTQRKELFVAIAFHAGDPTSPIGNNSSTEHSAARLSSATNLFIHLPNTAAAHARGRAFVVELLGPGSRASDKVGSAGNVLKFFDVYFDGQGVSLTNGSPIPPNGIQATFGSAFSLKFINEKASDQYVIRLKPVGDLRDTSNRPVTGTTFTSYIQSAITIDGQVGYRGNRIKSSATHTAMALTGATANKSITLDKSGSAITLRDNVNFTLELLGPYPAGTTPHTGATGVGSGQYATVIKSFNVLFNWTPAAALTNAAGTKLPRLDHQIAQVGKAPMDIKYDRTGTSGNFVLRIKLDGEADVSGNIQGLNAAKRTALYSAITGVPGTATKAATHIATTLGADANLPIDFSAASDAVGKTFTFDLLSGAATVASPTDGTLIQQVKVLVINPTGLLGPQAGTSLTLADGTELSGGTNIPDDAVIPLRLTQIFPRLYLRDTTDDGCSLCRASQTQRRKHKRPLQRHLTPILVNRKRQSCRRLQLPQ